MTTVTALWRERIVYVPPERPVSSSGALYPAPPHHFGFTACQHHAGVLHPDSDNTPLLLWD
ncbi:hypothetical protein KCP73_11615 [Salmonella enterica subsp. enterica]|nr:hypothetical protein KCP73_11615 [Salmonella enterica subsp. enterica]